MKCFFLAIFCYLLSLHNASAMLAEIMIWWRLFLKVADKKSFSAVFYEKEGQQAGISGPSGRDSQHIKLIAGGVHGFSSFHIFISFSISSAFHFFFSHATFRGKRELCFAVRDYSAPQWWEMFYSHLFPSQAPKGALFKSTGSFKHMSWEENPSTKYLVSWKQRGCRRWGEMTKEINFCLHKQMFVFVLSDVWEREKECA